MTFPDIPTGAAGRQVTGTQADTSATRTFPNLSGLTKNNGDLLIAIVGAYQTTAAGGAIWSGWSAGWTEFLDVGGSSNTAIGAAYKWSDGTETGTISVTQAGTITGHAAFILLSISTAHATTPPEGGTIGHNTAAAATPGTLDPAGWATEDTLWISVAVGGETGTAGSFTGLGAAPTNYGNAGITAISADVIGGLNLGAAFRQLNAASTAAGGWTVDTSNARNSAVMIAVRGGIPNYAGASAMTAPSAMVVGGIKETSGTVAMTAPSTLAANGTIQGQITEGYIAYGFDENTGTTSANKGTTGPGLTGVTGWTTPGQSGTGACMTGTLSTGASFTIPTSQGSTWTMMGWFRVRSTGGFASLWEDGTNFLEVNGLVLDYYNGTAIAGGTLTSNTWTHIAVTQSGTTGRLVVNGTQVGTDAVGLTLAAATYKLGGSTTQPFTGEVDDFRIIVGSALTDSEIQNYMNNPVSSVATYQGTVAMTAPSTLTSNATPERFAAVAMTAASALVSNATVAPASGVAMTAPGAMSVVATAERPATTAMTAPSTLTSNAVREKIGAAAMTAPSTLTANAIKFNPLVPFPMTVSGRKILDQNSNPYFVSMYHQWNLIGWGGGRNETGVGTTTPHSAFDAVGSALQANGINTILVLSITSNQGGETGPNQNGNTWDGVAPWSGGTPGNLNETYWARVDDLIDTMAGYGITVYLFLISSYTIATGTAYASMTAGQATTFGSNLAARYKDRQNIIWGFGADYFDSVPTQIQNICTALRAGGDTHLISLEFMAESGTYIKSEGNAAGTVPTQVDFADVYSYNAAALEVRRAYGATTKPVVFANGHYYQGGTADEKVMSDLLGWAFTSGSAGFFVGSEGTWQNNTGYLTNINNDPWPNTNYPAVRTALIGLTEWSNLVPASGATFVTSSRGTDATAITSGGSGGQYDAADPQNNYLTCAVTADGKLGVVYTPTSRTGITVDTSKLVATYDVFWVDPHNGSTSSTSVAGSYNTPGNNSAGNGGWYLVFQASTTKQGASAMTAPSALTVAAFLAEFGTVAMTAPSTLTSAAVRTTAGAVAMTAASTLAASGVREQPATVTMTAPSALATAGVRTTAGSVTMTASSTLAATAVRTTDAIVAMSAPSTLVSAAFLTLPAVTAMTASSTLTVAGVRSTDGTVVMTAPSVLVSAATSSGSGGVAMTAPSVFVAGAFKTTAGATNMTAPSVLTVAGVRTTSGTVAMTAQGALVVAAFRGLLAAATMTAPSTLTAGSLVSHAAAVVMVAASVLIATADGTAPSSPFYFWNGSTASPMTMKYWNGTTELPLASYSIAP